MLTCSLLCSIFDNFGRYRICILCWFTSHRVVSCRYRSIFCFCWCHLRLFWCCNLRFRFSNSLWFFVLSFTSWWRHHFFLWNWTGWWWHHFFLWDGTGWWWHHFFLWDGTWGWWHHFSFRNGTRWWWIHFLSWSWLNCFRLNCYSFRCFSLWRYGLDWLFMWRHRCCNLFLGLLLRNLGLFLCNMTICSHSIRWMNFFLSRFCFAFWTGLERLISIWLGSVVWFHDWLMRALV